MSSFIFCKSEYWFKDAKYMSDDESNFAIYDSEFCFIVNPKMMNFILFNDKQNIIGKHQDRIHNQSNNFSVSMRVKNDD